MKTITITATLTYDDNIMHGTDEESRTWFFEQILLGEELFVHSNEIGDTVGTMRISQTLETVGAAS